jgi:hypothetical protein
MMGVIEEQQSTIVGQNVNMIYLQSTVTTLVSNLQILLTRY